MMMKRTLTAVKYREISLRWVNNGDDGRRSNIMDVGIDGDRSEENHGKVINSDGVFLKEEEEICSGSKHNESSSAVNHMASLLQKDKKSADIKLKLRGVMIEEVREESTSCTNLEKGKAVLDQNGLLAGSEDSSSSGDEKKCGCDRWWC